MKRTFCITNRASKLTPCSEIWSQVSNLSRVPVNSSHGELVTGDEFTVAFFHFCDEFTVWRLHPMTTSLWWVIRLMSTLLYISCWCAVSVSCCCVLMAYTLKPILGWFFSLVTVQTSSATPCLLLIQQNKFSGISNRYVVAELVWTVTFSLLFYVTF